MRKKNTLDVLRKYYLTERHNLIILVIMCFFNLFYVIILVPPIEKALTYINSFFTLSGLSVIGIISYLFTENRIKKQITEYYCSDMGKNIKEEPFKVSRDYYLEKLKKGKGCFFILGESGIGKSRLLCQLKEQLGEFSTCDFVKNNYFNCIAQINNADYIIFDQFEKILDLSEPNKIIEHIKSLNDGNRTIIFSVRKEYFAEIYKMFDYQGNLLWIDFNAQEKFKIISQLLNLIGDENPLDTLNYKSLSDKKIEDKLYSSLIDNDKQIKLDLLKQIVIDVIENKILFIQLTYLGRILQQDNKNEIQQAENDWRECKDYKILIMHYIEKEIDQFIHSDVAYIILFLLCQDTKGIYANEIDDFANITIQSDDVVKSTVEYLEGIQLILPIKSDNNQRGMYISQYEIVHSYIQDILLSLCNNKLDIGLRNNIMFYSREYQIKRNESSIQEDNLRKEEISGKREEYIKNEKFLFGSLSVMLIIITILNIYYGISCVNSSDYVNKCVMMFFTNITVTVSTYYIFNYYHYFMRVFGNKYRIGVVVAMISVVLSYVIPNYWAIGYGSAILVTGIIMHAVTSNTRISEKSFFDDRCRNFIIIGAIVIVLSCFYELYTHGEMWLGWPCYILYSGYMLLGIMGHINRPYILALLGKVLYKDRKENIK